MCLILLANDAHPRYRLVVAANRDEFYARPTAPAAWWDDAGDVLGGRDLRGGGSWLGVTRAGRWAALTNYRDRAGERKDAPSRGELVGDFLRGADSPAEYLDRLRSRAARYNGFNLLVGDVDSVFWLSNRAADQRRGAQRVAPGVHGLSNHLLDTPWPKVVRGTSALRGLLGEADLAPGALLDLLLDRTVAADHQLPDTGVGVELERALSTLFIATPGYGTRASTALLIDRDGRALFVERGHAPGADAPEERRFEFLIEPATRPRGAVA
jgi:uncharacterized protein with NRDE domain